VKPFDRQTNEFKRALCGRKPTYLIALFCLFCVVLICFVGICPNMMRKIGNFLKPLTRSSGTARACGGTTVKTYQQTKKNTFSLIQPKQTSLIFNF